MTLHSRLVALTQGVRGHVLYLIALGLGIVGTYVGGALLTAQIISQMFAGAAWQSIVPALTWIVAPIFLRGVLYWLREVGAMQTAAGVK